MSFMSINRNYFIGRLKESPKIETSLKGQEILHFILCCDRENEPSRCDFIPCLAVGGLAKNMQKNLKKDSFLYVEGVNQSSLHRIGQEEFLRNEIFVKKAVFLNSIHVAEGVRGC